MYINIYRVGSARSLGRAQTRPRSFFLWVFGIFSTRRLVAQTVGELTRGDTTATRGGARFHRWAETRRPFVWVVGFAACDRPTQRRAVGPPLRAVSAGRVRGGLVYRAGGTRVGITAGAEPLSLTARVLASPLSPSSLAGGRACAYLLGGRQLPA